jgi:hypothetical protein
MPLIRIDMIKGRSPEQIKALLDATHRALGRRARRGGLHVASVEVGRPRRERCCRAFVPSKKLNRRRSDQTSWSNDLTTRLRFPVVGIARKELYHERY